mmetsp:Transcript_12709/g.41041  ORF Transcript_12709/g.41041 Transcript_12709/m.41041 type:complete len:735 (-) Transcript_12709:50-2254(-)
MRCLVFVPPKEWDASWAWGDDASDAYWKDRAATATVTVKSASFGQATSVDFAMPMRPSLPGGQAIADGHGTSSSSSSSAAAAAAAAATPGLAALVGLVERAGGNALALGALDSLQAITLAELIRKELGPVVSVAEVLKCADVAQLAAVVEAGAGLAAAAAAAAACGAGRPLSAEEIEGLPDADGAYRVYTMQFPRMPVDWMVRYTGSGHLDLDALQRATDRLVARHSALQTVQSPDEPLRDSMDKVVALWQLWASVFGGQGDGFVWQLASTLAGRCLFECWPRTVVRSAAAAQLVLRVLEDPSPRDKKWDFATDDQYIHSTIKEMASGHRWPFDIFVVPLFKTAPPPEAGQPANAAQAAKLLPPEAVSWYIYCGITHAYSDGASGQALMSDLLRFYAEEVGLAPPQPRPPAPEQLALLQRRLRGSLRGRAPGRAPDPNNDVFHEVVCEDWGKRTGFSARLFLERPVLSALRAAAVDVMGCGADVAWLTAVMGAMFRLFPEQKSIRLALKVACRDGPGEVQMVGFLSEHRLFVVDVLEPETSTLADVAETIGSARRARAWRAPMPYEAGLTVFVNIVSAMVDGLPQGFKHVVKPAPASQIWRSQAYCHLNLRIDQVTATEWDFRVFHFDSAWGWSWIKAFADALGGVIHDMATTPTTPLLRPSSPQVGSGSKRRADEALAVEVAPGSGSVGFGSGGARIVGGASACSAGTDLHVGESEAEGSRRRKAPRVDGIHD